MLAHPSTGEDTDGLKQVLGNWRDMAEDKRHSSAKLGALTKAADYEATTLADSSVDRVSTLSLRCNGTSIFLNYGSLPRYQ